MFQHVRHPHTLDQIRNHFFGKATTHDAESHGRSITGWHGRYEHVGRKAFRGEITELRLWPIQMFLERLSQPCVYRGSAWSGALVFVSVAPFAGNLSFDGRALASSTINLLPCDCLNSSFNSSALDTITIAVQETAFIDYAKSVFGRVISRESLRRNLAIEDVEAFTEFQRCVTALFEQVVARPALLDEERFRTCARDGVLNMLIHVLDMSMRGARALSAPSTRSYIVEKAIQYIGNRLADNFEMTDLCHSIRVCPRTLRYSFEEVLGVSPTEYLLATRLAHARRALLHANTASNIQCIAARYGFSHMGRFARYYSNTYGERPSDTLRRSGMRSDYGSPPDDFRIAVAG
jgi:AraC family ethanolamine operon transcriptional activator